MNKKLIAAAVAAGLAAPMAASADMKISGRVAQDLVFTSDGVDTRSLEDAGTARIQFDGAQEAGAVTMYGRLALDMRDRVKSEGQNRFGPQYRDRYVGLRGGFGAIQAGRMAGAIKNLEKDPYITTFLQARATSAVGGGIYGSNSFVDDLLQYSNSFGNVNFVAQYNPTTDAAGKDAGDTAVALKGDFGGVRAWAGWNNAGDSGNDNAKVGASMGFGAVDLTAQYEMRDGADTGVAQSGDRMFVMANMGFGGGLSGNVAFGRNDDAETNWYRLAVAKSLTKGATVYAGVTSEEAVAVAGAGAGDDTTNFGVGAELRF